MGRITQRFIFVPLPPSHRSSRLSITFSQWTTARRRSRLAVLVMSSSTAPAGSFRISYRSHQKTTWRHPLLQLRSTSKACYNLYCPSSQTSNNTIEGFACLERARSTCQGYRQSPLWSPANVQLRARMSWPSLTRSEMCVLFSRFMSGSDLPESHRSVSVLAIFTHTASSPMRRPSWIPLMVLYASLSSTIIR
jgi:hypothetical protein